MAEHTTRVITFAASGARTATGRTDSFIVDDLLEGRMEIDVTAVSGTGTPTINFYVQHQPDGSTTWFDVASQTGITATGQSVILSTNFAKTLSLYYTITGTTPSFTFSALFTGKT